jgi:hypothetical protein
VEVNAALRLGQIEACGRRPLVQAFQASRARSWAGVLAALATENGAASRPAISPRKPRRSIIRSGPALPAVLVVPTRGSVLSHVCRHRRSLRSAAGNHPSHVGFARRLQDLAGAGTGSWLWWPNALSSSSGWSQPGCSRGSLGPSRAVRKGPHDAARQQPTG